MKTFIATAKWRTDVDETADWVTESLTPLMAAMNEKGLTMMKDAAAFLRPQLLALTVTYGGHHVAVVEDGVRIALLVNDGCCKSCSELAVEERRAS